MTVAHHGCIQIRGAREHTLANIDVDIPKRQLTVVTGVSGSGKSSLVFDTLAAESQRQLNSTYSAFAQNRLPSYGEPDVDSLANLCAVTVVDQKRLGGGARSTVGTATDIGARLRLLFSRAGSPSAGYSNAYSFNDPQGMCPSCQGLGVVSVVDEDELVDLDRSLDEGAITIPAFAVGQWFWKAYALTGLFDTTKPLRDYTADEWHILMHAKPGEVTAPNADAVGTTYEGVVSRFSRIYLAKDADAFKGKHREAFERIVARGTCPACGGTRLNELVRSSLIGGRSIADMYAMQVDDLVGVVRAVDDPAVAPLVDDVVTQLSRLGTLGLGYVSLDRSTSTLSGGESQRVKMVRHLGSSLTDMLYVFDEPTVGLHPRDVHRLGEMLQDLRDKGNTVVVVEHDPEIMAIADHCIDMGPGAGRAGGLVTFAGPFDELVRSDTRTGAGLRTRRPVTTEPRTPAGAVRIEHASTHNLRDVTVDLPLGVLTVVTGVAGSGKSSLVHGHLPAVRPDTVLLDQRPIRGSRRSSPATFTGLLDPIRKLFARATGVPASMFSPNSAGACDECHGAGVIFTDLAFMDGVTTVCEVCRGRRFTAEAQQYLVRGRSIADVFEMSVAEAVEFFDERSVLPTLRRMADVGLEYLALGQTLTTLSGGERQRLKLANELADDGKLYVLDEPTTGLHLADIERLVALLNRLVDDGNTVIVIEHNLDVVTAADWVVDLGPEAGHDGGQVVFEGTVDELSAHGDTHTAEHLRRHLDRSVSMA
ncbi:excinuclease ABC A subunit [Haloactinopolyspora alba]|uniref:UvrABC system protein A n=1 Tax=Haloactinopolyspora alba TaxID=648780 RepID=A0A2P8DYV9_9ACTN|nr:excinuclease ABC subunit UvrA [Haloactinopolyspora alba]PSL02406.1 excinuclease ABC A subunit [Haloactinopolyspora alba]